MFRVNHQLITVLFVLVVSILIWQQSTLAPTSVLDIHKKGQETILKWKPNEHQNVSYFVVEKASGRHGFKQVAQLDATLRNQDSAFSYSDTDTDSTTKYRLKTVLKDGKVYTSKIVSYEDAP